VTSVLDRAARITGDRVHGAGYLARQALGLLAAATPEERARLVALLRTARPAMPAIAAAVDEALRDGDVRAVLRRADAARQRVVQEARVLLAGHPRVATISNSSLVTRTLVAARPPVTIVATEGEQDEGWLLVAELRTLGLEASGVPVAGIDAGIAVVGCDAIFDNGGFVNRRGTASLLARMRSRPMLVLGEPWKVVAGVTPASWPEPDLFEVVRPGANVLILH
jgi:translation initiation factor 2B subunit (eIF-2B alpha/beta/delta family)